MGVFGNPPDGVITFGSFGSIGGWDVAAAVTEAVVCVPVVVVLVGATSSEEVWNQTDEGLAPDAAEMVVRCVEVEANFVVSWFEVVKTIALADVLVLVVMVPFVAGLKVEVGNDVSIGVEDFEPVCVEDPIEVSVGDAISVEFPGNIEEGTPVKVIPLWVELKVPVNSGVSEEEGGLVEVIPLSVELEVPVNTGASVVKVAVELEGLVNPGVSVDKGRPVIEMIALSVELVGPINTAVSEDEGTPVYVVPVSVELAGDPKIVVSEGNAEVITALSVELMGKTKNGVSEGSPEEATVVSVELTGEIKPAVSEGSFVVIPVASVILAEIIKIGVSVERGRPVVVLAVSVELPRSSDTKVSEDKGAFVVVDWTPNVGPAVVDSRDPEEDVSEGEVEPAVVEEAASAEELEEASVGVVTISVVESVVKATGEEPVVLIAVSSSGKLIEAMIEGVEDSTAIWQSEKGYV